MRRLIAVLLGVSALLLSPGCSKSAQRPAQSQQTERTDKPSLEEKSQQMKQNMEQINAQQGNQEAPAQQ